MSGTRVPFILFLALIVAAVAQAIKNYALLPDRMASHFGVSGAPNNWMDKPQFFMVYAGVVVLAAIVGFAVPWRIAQLPPSSINLPNKEYWLAPERRDETFAFLQRHFAWFGCALLLLLVCVMELVMRADLDPAPQLPAQEVLLFIFGFLLFTFFWIVAIFRRFSLPRESA